MPITHIFPENLSPSGKIPLIMLHGYGSNEMDLYELKNSLPKAYFPIALRAYSLTPYGGFAWYPLYMDASGNLHIKEDEMLRAIINLHHDIQEIIKEFDFNKAISLLGFSQGSIVSYALMSHYPDVYGNIVAFSGYIHEPVMMPLNKEESKHLSVFASHGTNDDIIPVEWARKIPLWLERNHVRHIYKEYNAGHFLVPQNIHDAMQFLEANAY